MKKYIILTIVAIIASMTCMGQRTQQRQIVRKVNKFACYRGESGIVKVSESKDWIYMLESGKYPNDNNGVIRVNKTTGVGEVVIEGQADIYEDRHDVISDIAVTENDKLFFVCGDFWKDSQKLYLWDGKSVETSKVVCKAYEVKASPSGRYVVCRSSNHVAYIYDGTTFEKVGTAKNLELKTAEIDDQGGFWDANDMSYTPLGGSKRKINTNYGEANTGYSPVFSLFLGHGNKAYVSYGRRIYLYDDNNPDVFTEYARVPRTSDWTFLAFAVTPSGDILAANHLERLVEYRKGHFDTPIEYELGGIKTDVRSMPDSPNRESIWTVPSIVDSNGNYIVYGDIYNPYGIKGYAKGLGHKVKVKKSGTTIY